MNSKQLGIIVCLCLVVAVICTSDLLAQKKFSGKGKGMHGLISEDVQELEDGRTLRHSRQEGFILADDETHPLHMASIACSGISLVEADGIRRQGSGTCIEIDREGDMAWSWWAGSNEGVKWGYLNGTGKYAGATGTGSSKTLETLANGKWIEEWEGTLELK